MINIHIMKLSKYALATLLMASMFMSCKDDEDDVAPVVVEEEEQLDNPNVAINQWIYDVMDEVYYWTDQMPKVVNKQQQPEDFYKSLLSSEDRFSHIVPSYQGLINSLNGISKEAGYEFMLSRAEANSDDVIATILYVKNNSPAKDAGLKRGDVIKRVNGQQITVSNYREIVGEMSENHSISYERYSAETASYEPQEGLTLQTIELAENPNFLDTVYTVAGHKVGYYVYNFFSPGENKKEYDQQMDQIIADFNSKGVSDLILDLRYNSGGAISSATNLGSLIGRDVNDTKVFYENRWNQLIQEYWESQENGDARLRGRFVNKTEKIGDNLPSGRLYILVGSRSASASELIINGLKPYMDVYLIGDKTVGKNVGSIPIEDRENPENEYGILPIVFQIYNSEGFSDYSQGFVPNDVVKDITLPMKQLGDVEEPLLARALEVITGSGARMKPQEADRENVFEPIGSSIDAKLRTNRLIYDLPISEH
jgi:carboxyl-terminal processing protease